MAPADSPADAGTEGVFAPVPGVLAGSVAGRLDRPVVLIGMMGSGKSQIGRALAKTMGLPFCDSDQAFEAAAGSSIADYFARHGEDDFRQGEYKVMERLLDGTPKIIAAGGGIITLPQTRALLRERAVAIWLTADVETLAARCAGNNRRPLLNAGEPAAILAGLLEKRGGLYAEVAAFSVATDGPDGHAAPAHILKGLETWLETR